jgi:RHS repeat-associated protein
LDGEQRLALVETRTADTAGTDRASEVLVRYQYGNHLGSASLELDERGRVVSYEEYSPYGSTTYQAVAGQTETPKRYRFTGKERDEETGLSYHGARYYAPWLGRWTSCDPKGVVPGPNAYVYAAASPTRLVDHDGREPGHPEDSDIHQVWVESKEPSATPPQVAAVLPPAGGAGSGGPDEPEPPPRERGKGGFKKGQGEDQREGLERARDAAKRDRPSIKTPSGKDAPETEDEWEGARKRPKQRKIESGKKSADRDAKERDEKYRGKDPAGKPQQKSTVSGGAGNPYRDPADRPVQPDHPYFPAPEPRPVPTPKPTPQPIPPPAPVPTPSPAVPEPTPFFPPPGRNPSGLTPEQLARSAERDKPLVQNATTEIPTLLVAVGVGLLLAPEAAAAGAYVTVSRGVVFAARSLALAF